MDRMSLIPSSGTDGDKPAKRSAEKSLSLDFLLKFCIYNDMLKKYKSANKSAKCFIRLIK